MKFKWPYFGTSRRYSHIVGHAGSTTGIVHADVTDPIQGQGQGYGAFELPPIAHNCTFLGLYSPPLSGRAQNLWLMVIVWDLVYSLSEPNFRISFQESYHESSNFAKCRYFTNSNGRISVLCNATVTSLGMLVVLHVLCMLTFP